MTATACRRGTTNGNARGSSYTRAARRAWLLATYAANVQVVRPRVETAWGDIHPTHLEDQARWMGDLDALGVAYDLLATCRCYRCGVLLVDGTLTVDRIIPGVKGGTYRRDNIRPACGGCNSETGAKLASRPKRTKR